VRGEARMLVTCRLQQIPDFPVAASPLTPALSPFSRGEGAAPGMKKTKAPMVVVSEPVGAGLSLSRMRGEGRVRGEARMLVTCRLQQIPDFPVAASPLTPALSPFSRGEGAAPGMKKTKAPMVVVSEPVGAGLSLSPECGERAGEGRSGHANARDLQAATNPRLSRRRLAPHPSPLPVFTGRGGCAGHEEDESANGRCK